MIIVLLLFAFTMSLIKGFLEKVIGPIRRDPKEEPLEEKPPRNSE